MSAPVYILGGYQTDFARNWMKEGQDIVGMIKESVSEGFKAARLEPQDVDVAHVGNFAAELYCKQGHLGAFLAERLSARKRSGLTAHIRNPKAGQWEDYFTPRVNRYFERLHGQLLDRYGY